MFRMDTYLAQIFKEKKNRAGGETAQSQLVLFKLRVLSLLEIYFMKIEVSVYCIELSFTICQMPSMMTIAADLNMWHLQLVVCLLILWKFRNVDFFYLDNFIEEVFLFYPPTLQAP